MSEPFWNHIECEKPQEIFQELEKESDLAPMMWSNSNIMECNWRVPTPSTDRLERLISILKESSKKYDVTIVHSYGIGVVSEEYVINYYVKGKTEQSKNIIVTYDKHLGTIKINPS